MFKLTYTSPPGNDIATLEVTFHAPHRIAAEGWVRMFCKQIGINPEATTLTRIVEPMS